MAEQQQVGPAEEMLELARVAQVINLEDLRMQRVERAMRRMVAALQMLTPAAQQMVMARLEAERMQALARVEMERRQQPLPSETGKTGK